MISQEKLMTLIHLQKLPKNVRDLDKLIVSKDFKKLPKVQKIAQSGHTATNGLISYLLHLIGQLLEKNHSCHELAVSIWKRCGIVWTSG